MRKSKAEGAGFRPLEDWAAIAEQVANKTEQEVNRHSRPTRTQSLFILGFLAFGILYALTSLLFPQAVAFRGPANGWLSAHPVADVAGAIVLTVAWWGLRIWLSYSDLWRSKDGISRLKLK